MNKFMIGSIPLKKGTKKDTLIPKQALPVDILESDLRALGISIKNNLPSLLIGETGTGKTSIIRRLAYQLNKPYVRVNMTGFTTPDELIGSKSVKDGRTYYEDGVITDAMKRCKSISPPCCK